MATKSYSLFEWMLQASIPHGHAMAARLMLGWACAGVVCWICEPAWNLEGVPPPVPHSSALKQQVSVSHHVLRSPLRKLDHEAGTGSSHKHFVAQLSQCAMAPQWQRAAGSLEQLEPWQIGGEPVWVTLASSMRYATTSDSLLMLQFLNQSRQVSMLS